MSTVLTEKQMEFRHETGAVDADVHWSHETLRSQLAASQAEVERLTDHLHGCREQREAAEALEAMAHTEVERLTKALDATREGEQRAREALEEWLNRTSHTEVGWQGSIRVPPYVRVEVSELRAALSPALTPTRRWARLLTDWHPLPWEVMSDGHEPCGSIRVYDAKGDCVFEVNSDAGSRDTQRRRAIAEAIIRTVGGSSAAQTRGERHDWRLVGTTDEMPQGALYRCHDCLARVELPSSITGSMYAIATWLDKQAGPCKPTAAPPTPPPRETTEEAGRVADVLARMLEYACDFYSREDVMSIARSRDDLMSVASIILASRGKGTEYHRAIEDAVKAVEAEWLDAYGDPRRDRVIATIRALDGKVKT